MAGELWYAAKEMGIVFVKDGKMPLPRGRCLWRRILAVKLFEREGKLIIQEKYSAGMEGFLPGGAGF